MAMRGRGRGGGGRGFGGRSGPPGGPIIRDDDGSVVPSQPLGPPLTYPDIELPEHSEINPKDALLLLRRQDLVNYSKRSPFYLEGPKRTRDGPDAGVERYSDRTNKAQKQHRQPLSSVLTLIPEYFPEELYAPSDRAAKIKSHDAFWKLNGTKEEVGGLQRIEQLAQLESKAQGAQGRGGVPTAADDAPVEEAAEVDTDDEEDMENDDYYQGQTWDDDDGYGDDGGDDGDGDAIY